MTVLHTSQNVMEADTLLNEANRKLDQSRDALGPGSYEMAQGWLEISRDLKAGLENKDVLRRSKQVQQYLGKAKETHEAIMQLTEGVYYRK